MVFIALLMAATTAIAGSAAYFSVYGLAHTFSGIFWSAAAMGASLEAGKLVAASYLYRYWTRTGLILKTSLILGVIALMGLTSLGIFGYLSSGYQQDVLPLKQKQQQVQLLEAEKERALTRKRQIDDIIAGNSSTATTGTGTGANAARILRETNRGRDQIARQFREEQKEVTQRVAQLDQELLALKQDLIKSEAHIGPIIFVAQAFNASTDDATKWLIFLIIFAFDPMAIALTIAVNTALRLHKEDQQALKAVAAPVSPPAIEPDPVPEPVVETPLTPEPEPTIELDLQYDNQTKVPPAPEPQLELVDIEEPEPEPAVVEAPAAPVSTAKPPAGINSRFLGFANDGSLTKINELVTHLRYLKERQAQGFQLTEAETWELQTIEDILRKHGYDKYM